LLSDDFGGLRLIGKIFSASPTWCERFRRPIRGANLFAMSVNLLCPAAAWQGIILSALFCIFE
jgi:hypothetical protein